MVKTSGIHHVTAIAGDPQQNIDFYAGVLGLRLVKLTVNFDDPGAYHLYYGDEAGHPGTIMTFFSWPGARHGRRGVGQVGITSFAVPPDSLDFWRKRLAEAGARFANPLEEEETKFGQHLIGFLDPDGLFLEIVEFEPARDWPFWGGADVPEKNTIRGFMGVTLEEEGYLGTQELLTDTLGFRYLGEEGQMFGFMAGEESPGSHVAVRSAPGFGPGTVAVGTVHHVAFRAETDDEQVEFQDDLAELGYNVTPILDRQYFHSIYFREPGGVLFEIATDPPGFSTDEEVALLGSHLKLPPWLEPQRAQIEQALPPVKLPATPAP